MLRIGKKSLELLDKISFFEQKVATLFTLLAKIVAIFSGILIIISSLKGILLEHYTIEPFEVPEAFSSNGITGTYINQRINDEIIQIRKIGWSVYGLRVKPKDEEEIKNDIVIFGVSLNLFRSLIREALGIKNKTISGNIATKGERLEISFSVSAGESVTLIANTNEFPDVHYATEHLLSEISKALLEEIDPFVLASYYWAKQNESKSLAIIQEMLSQNEHSRDSAYLLWGEVLFEKSKHAQAIEKFKDGLAINPNNALLWTAIGTVYYELEAYDKALENFDISGAIDEEIWSTWYFKGMIAGHRKNPMRAIEYFKKALIADFTPWKIYNDLSYEYEAINDLPSAIKTLKNGILVNPEEPILHATLAEKYWAFKQPEKAHQAIKEALKYNFDMSEYRDIEPYKSYLQQVSPPMPE